MFEDELATIACRSLGGEPIANIEWSKDGEKFEPTHTSLFMNEIVSYISLNLTEDLLGAVFICTSSHVLYEEPKTCQVGPLEFELKQFIVEIEPAVLNARPGDEGMFECIVDSHYPVLDYVWRFEGEEINETDNRFKFDKNNTILHVLNITKDMDESEVTCEVTNTHENESASAIIRFGGHHRGLDALSVAIIAAIMTFVFIMIILVLILFYFFWWKKRKEKEIPSNQPVVEDGSSEVRKSTDSNLDGTISPKSGQANPAYVIESDIPLEKNGKLPAIRSHTPVGGRPNTADITYHRSEHKHSHRRHKKHKRKRIRPTEPKSPRSYDNGKPRVLDHFVVNSVDQETLLEKSTKLDEIVPKTTCTRRLWMHKLRHTLRAGDANGRARKLRRTIYGLVRQPQKVTDRELVNEDIDTVDQWMKSTTVQGSHPREEIVTAVAAATTMNPKMKRESPENAESGRSPVTVGVLRLKIAI
uniref:Uncharacterized protein LOC102802677 n=1 Tax=Saccoglossus kowalevskii TaxID=10224 RepID=A0ABM0MP08_SACKO|nr:PREDICTED: uncharacterized protein LOC102802677 [Saccoglossus kowalevskii]